MTTFSVLEADLSVAFAGSDMRVGVRHFAGATHEVFQVGPTRIILNATVRNCRSRRAWRLQQLTTDMATCSEQLYFYRLNHFGRDHIGHHSGMKFLNT